MPIAMWQTQWWRLLAHGSLVVAWGNCSSLRSCESYSRRFGFWDTLELFEEFVEGGVFLFVYHGISVFCWGLWTDNKKFIALLRGQFVSQYVALCFVRGVLEMLPGGHFTTRARGLTSRTWSRDPTIEPLAAVLVSGCLTTLECPQFTWRCRSVAERYDKFTTKEGSGGSTRTAPPRAGTSYRKIITNCVWGVLGPLRAPEEEDAAEPQLFVLVGLGLGNLNNCNMRSNPRCTCPIRDGMQVCSIPACLEDAKQINSKMRRDDVCQKKKVGFRWFQSKLASRIQEFIVNVDTRACQLDNKQTPANLFHCL